MNEAQSNAVSLVKSPHLMDPITYQLAIQVLKDAQEHYALAQKDLERIEKAEDLLTKLYKAALTNYVPLSRQPRPDIDKL